MGSAIPNEVVKKNHEQAVYFKKNKQSILQDYLNQELTLKERVAYENRSETNINIVKEKQ